MKSRFTTLDLQAEVAELQSRIVGMRLANIYDVDKKTFLFKFARAPDKAVLLIEAGIRVHTTEFDWPKQPSPSAFAMKLRKHVRTKRLTGLIQYGSDRVVDLVLGSGEVACHVIVELYDKGNLILTDHEYTILAVLRPRKDDQDVRFAVHERYPFELAHRRPEMSPERLAEIVGGAEAGTLLRKLLGHHLSCGPAAVEHALLKAGYSPKDAAVGKNDEQTDLVTLLEAVRIAEGTLAEEGVVKGVIVQKLAKRAQVADGDSAEVLIHDSYHPRKFVQFEGQPCTEFESFDRAVDVFYSELEEHKTNMRAVRQEQAALNKLEAVKNRIGARINQLKDAQEGNVQRAELIELNLDLVDQALKIIRSAVANGMDWQAITDMVAEAKAQGDPVGRYITKLKLDTNQITLRLSPAFVDEDSESSDSDEDSPDEAAASGKGSGKHKAKGKGKQPKGDGSMNVDVDLDLTAYANARKYYEEKRTAAYKEEKTMEASAQALKAAELKAQQTIKQVALKTSVSKARKPYWFEKFLWFISSENYLVVAGRDKQQNEQLVRRHLTEGDAYVHADMHGASSVIVKNEHDREISPVTLAEAGTFAICNSSAWDAKIVANAYWVHADQVSKTAPSGEYLTTGSFMVRGKKNYLPHAQLVVGFGLLFKVDESSIANHIQERRARVQEEEEFLADPEPGHGGGNTPSVPSDALSADGEGREPEAADGGQAATGTAATEGDAETAAAEQDDGNDGTAEEDGPAFPESTIGLTYSSDSVQVETQLSSQPSAAGTEDGAEDSAGQPHRAPRLSAKQRREMKKKAQFEREMASASEKPPEPEAESEQRPKRQPKPKGEAPPAKVPRGKKKKMKKMREKYGDQDADERKLRMELLASGGATKTRKEKREQRRAKGKASKGPPQAKGAQAALEDVEEFLPATDYQAQSRTAEEKDQKAIEQAERQQQAEIERILEDENLQLLDDDQKESLTFLDALTGLPREDDGLLFALPVIAPYSVLRAYKYKSKMVPGTMKKGKAARSAIQAFLHHSQAHAREKDLMRCIKDAELSRNLPGKVKLMGAQGGGRPGKGKRR